MAQIQNLQFSAVLDKSGTIPVMRITDTTNYPGGVANNITGVFTITQPDGVSYIGSFATPDVYYYSGALFCAPRELRLANDTNFQSGTYTITYTVNHPSYDQTSTTQSFTVNYTRPTAVLTPTVDVFTPALKVNDVTNYLQTGLTLQSAIRSWAATSTPGTSIAGNVTQFDLNIGGHYYDAVYNITMNVALTYSIVGASNISLVDTMTDTATITTVVPDSINTLFTAINTFKVAADATGPCSCQAEFTDHQLNYMYAYILFTNYIEMGTCGNRGNLLSLYNELKAVLNKNVTPAYVQTNGIIPAYSFGAFCGRSATSIPFLITAQPVSLTKVSGNSATFNVAASGTPTITYQWRKNSVNIVGATSSSYTIASVGSGDQANYDCVLTDGLSNTLTSNTASLTVTVALTTFAAYWAWTGTDPFTALHSADAISYQGTANFTTGAPIVADFRTAPNLQFLVLKVPSTESIKTVYYNDPLINGNIPDAVWQSAFVTGGYRYYVTRQLVTFDPGQLTTFS